MNSSLLRSLMLSCCKALFTKSIKILLFYGKLSIWRLPKAMLWFWDAWQCSAIIAILLSDKICYFSVRLKRPTSNNCILMFTPAWFPSCAAYTVRTHASWGGACYKCCRYFFFVSNFTFCDIEERRPSSSPPNRHQSFVILLLLHNMSKLASREPFSRMGNYQSTRVVFTEENS